MKRITVLTAAVAAGALAVPQQSLATTPVAVVAEAGASSAGGAAPELARRTPPRAARAVTKPAPAKAAAPVVRRVAWDGRAFATPEAAMRFLVAAYNGHDDAALRHVTTPHARADLLGMREIAPTLRLRSCGTDDSGTTYCSFTHPVPGAKEPGYASLRVAPAARPGWYVSGLEGCG